MKLKVLKNCLINKDGIYLRSLRMRKIMTACPGGFWNANLLLMETGYRSLKIILKP